MTPFALADWAGEEGVGVAAWANRLVGQKAPTSKVTIATLRIIV
jgi:hypothetical protein